MKYVHVLLSEWPIVLTLGATGNPTTSNHSDDLSTPSSLEVATTHDNIGEVMNAKGDIMKGAFLEYGSTNARG
jgi:hypothetical protein